MQNLIKDHRVTIDGVANEVGITHGSAFAILSEDLGLIKLSARLVTKALKEDQLNDRADLSLAILLKMTQIRTIFFCIASLEMKLGSICLTQKTNFNQNE